MALDVSTQYLECVSPSWEPRVSPKSGPVALLSKGLSNFLLPGKGVSEADRRSLSANVCSDLMNYRKTSRQPPGKPQRAHSALKSPANLAWHKVAEAARAFLDSVNSVGAFGAHTICTDVHKPGYFHLGLF